jgi:hypothetical protein
LNAALQEILLMIRPSWGNAKTCFALTTLLCFLAGTGAQVRLCIEADAGMALRRIAFESALLHICTSGEVHRVADASTCPSASSAEHSSADGGFDSCQDVPIFCAESILLSTLLTAASPAQQVLPACESPHHDSMADLPGPAVAALEQLTVPDLRLACVRSVVLLI